MKARMFGQPLGDVVMLMGAVIVHNQVQVQATGDLSIKLAQKLQIFLMSMTLPRTETTTPRFDQLILFFMFDLDDPSPV